MIIDKVMRTLRRSEIPLSVGQIATETKHTKGQVRMALRNLQCNHGLAEPIHDFQFSQFKMVSGEQQKWKARRGNCMDTKYLAFDIEISKEIPEGENDWKAHRPLGITCAAAASSDGGLWNWWAQKPDGRFAKKISKGMCQTLVANLELLVRDAGYTLLTWNGLGFDFDILAEESGMYDECQILAFNHVDMMFQFHCSKGFPLGLDTAAKGMGLPGKPEGMDGAKAPELWAKGEYHRVLDYVSGDAKNTLAVAEAVDLAGRLKWTARSGRPNSWPCSKWLTVKEAMTLPEPDTSWMTDPWPRSKFYEWVHIPDLSPLPHFDVTRLIQHDPDEGMHRID